MRLLLALSILLAGAPALAGQLHVRHLDYWETLPAPTGTVPAEGFFIPLGTPGAASVIAYVEVLGDVTESVVQFDFIPGGSGGYGQAGPSQFWSAERTRIGNITRFDFASSRTAMIEQNSVYWEFSHFAPVVHNVSLSFAGGELALGPFPDPDSTVSTQYAYRVIYEWQDAVYGDLDGNGRVDLSDFGFFKTAFGRPPDLWMFRGGDLNGDPFADLADFEILKANFGMTVPARSLSSIVSTDGSGSTPVPEPATGLLLAIAGLSLATGARRFRPRS